MSSNTVRTECNHPTSRGAVAVEEFVSLLHAGAALKGPFSRVDYGNELFFPDAGDRSISSLCAICYELTRFSE